MLLRSVLCLFLTALAVHGQAQAFLGLRVAATRSRFFGEQATYKAQRGDTSFQQHSVPLLGSEFGLFAILPIKGRWLALQPEVNVARSMAGIDWLYANSGYSQDAHARYTFRSVQVPLLLRLSAGTRRLRIFALGGPYANYFYSGRFDIEWTEKEAPSSGGSISHLGFTRRLDFRQDSLRRLDAGLMLGGGATCKFGPVWLGFDLRYRAGFRELFYTSPAHFAAGVRGRLQAFAPSMFIMVPITKRKE